MRDDRLALLQVCTDYIAADVLVGFLRSEGIPAVAHNLSPVPGLEQGTEVLVPKAYLPRAQTLLEQQQPTDGELTELALRTAPEPLDR
jgi:Putative prokaryotic signal transducing protein